MSRSKILIVFLLGASLPLYILWEIFFSLDSRYSSIGEPQSGLKITQQNIAGRDLVVLPEEGRALFDLIDLRIETNKKINNSEKIKIKAYHNYLISFYPVQENQIGAEKLKELVFQNNSTDLAIGSIFINGIAVSIVSPDDSYVSVFNAELFEKMNYQWEDLVEKEIGFAGSMEDKGVFRYGQPHPDGTFIENNNQYYLVWQEQLIPIKKDVDIREISLAPIIKINDIKANSFDDCLIELDEKMECNFGKELDFKKSNYVFEIENLNQSLIDEIIVELNTTIKKETIKKNFSVSASDIKAKLIKKYGSYLPFI